MKLKRGNLCRLKYGGAAWRIVDGESKFFDMFPKHKGKKVIIDFSFNQVFGTEDSDEQEDKYSVIFLEDGHKSAWKTLDQLELLEEGGEHLFDEAKKNRDEINNNQGLSPTS